MTFQKQDLSGKKLIVGFENKLEYLTLICAMVKFPIISASVFKYAAMLFNSTNLKAMHWPCSRQTNFGTQFLSEVCKKINGNNNKALSPSIQVHFHIFTVRMFNLFVVALTV
jgi:hypothetical protein